MSVTERDSVTPVPRTRIAVGPGVELVLEHDPDGLAGRDLCRCGHPEDRHLHSQRSGLRECILCVCGEHRPYAWPDRLVEDALPPPRVRLPDRPRPSFLFEDDGAPRRRVRETPAARAALEEPGA